MNELTALQRDTLIVLDGLDEPAGIDIQAELTHYYEEEIFGGRLYPSLDSLVDKGLIRKESKDGRTNAYALTTDGKQLLDDRIAWEQRLLGGSDLERKDA